MLVGVAFVLASGHNEMVRARRPQSFRLACLLFLPSAMACLPVLQLVSVVALYFPASRSPTAAPSRNACIESTAIARGLLVRWPAAEHRVLTPRIAAAMHSACCRRYNQSTLSMRTSLPSMSASLALWPGPREKKDSTEALVMHGKKQHDDPGHGGDGTHDAIVCTGVWRARIGAASYMASKHPLLGLVHSVLVALCPRRCGHAAVAGMGAEEMEATILLHGKVLRSADMAEAWFASSTFSRVHMGVWFATSADMAEAWSASSTFSRIHMGVWFATHASPWRRLQRCGGQLRRRPEREVEPACLRRQDLRCGRVVYI